jgi:hypothetical protein
VTAEKMLCTQDILFQAAAILLGRVSMTVLQNLAAALVSGAVRVVDLSQPLSADTPVIGLPPPFAQTYLHPRSISSRSAPMT